MGPGRLRLALKYAVPSTAKPWHTKLRLCPQHTSIIYWLALKRVLRRVTLFLHSLFIPDAVKGRA